MRYPMEFDEQVKAAGSGTLISGFPAYVFTMDAPVDGDALRYAALFAAQMFLSASLVSLFAFLPVPLVVVKVVVDSVLFVFSFFFQRNWVFRPVSSGSKEARKRARGARKHERALESRPDVGLCDERVDIRR